MRPSWVLWGGYLGYLGAHLGRLWGPRGLALRWKAHVLAQEVSLAHARATKTAPNSPVLQKRLIFCRSAWRDGCDPEGPMDNMLGGAVRPGHTHRNFPEAAGAAYAGPCREGLREGGP